MFWNIAGQKMLKDHGNIKNTNSNVKNKLNLILKQGRRTEAYNWEHRLYICELVMLVSNPL